MAQFEKWFTTDLMNTIGHVKDIGTLMFTGDNNSHKIGVMLLNNRVPENVNGTVVGFVVRSDGSTVVQNGAKDGNKAWIVLPEAAFAYQGRISIAIQIVNGQEKTVVLAVSANVKIASTDTVVDPGTIIPSVSELIASIEAAVESIPQDYSTLSAAVTALQALPTDTVLYGSAQSLTDAQKTRARGNIGAAGEDDVADLKSAMSAMDTATSDDVGKVLKAKTVSEGKVTEWEFGTGTEPVITKVDYDDEDVVSYSSTASNTGTNLMSIVIAPNVTTGYYVKSAAVYATAGKDIKFSLFKIEPFYQQPDPLNRKKFIKQYDIATIKSDSDGKAEIVFDVPLYLVGGETVLCASATSAVMKYGAYVDALYTIFNYQINWYDLEPGEHSSKIDGWEYISSGNCPTYDIDYVLASDATAQTSTADHILQLSENYNQYDAAIDEHSNNAVRNSALYDQLNIVKTETIVPTETTRVNSDAVLPSGYNGWFTILYVDETEEVKLKSVDVFVKTNGVVKLGIWTYRPHSSGSVQGYLTLKAELGSATAADNHAVFTLDNVEFDPETEYIGLAASSGAIGYNTGVVNGFKTNWYNSDKGFYSTAVGAENSTLVDLPGKTTSTSGTVQGNYAITYQLAESHTVTTVTNVKNAVDGLLTDVEDLKQQAPVANSMLRTPYNKYFCVLVDDVNRKALTMAETLLSIGVKPAYGFKMESLANGEITWDELKRLQDMGFEIAFHGILHSRYSTPPNQDATMIADIVAYKELCKQHGIEIHGYLGPNHYSLPPESFMEFEWARTARGMTSYGGPNHLGTTFAAIVIWSCDPAASGGMAATKQDMLAAHGSLTDNQYLTPMCHTDNLYTYLDDYMDVFNTWIAAGIKPLRPMDAVKQGLFNAGGIGNNSTFAIQAGTATNPYYIIAGNGTILHNP